MLAFFSARDANFGHVIAVDTEFVLFSRAWCVAELAMSYNMGLAQHMIIHSSRCLLENKEGLGHLRVQDMKASRPEDVEEILAKIPCHEEFNAQLHKLIFSTLLVSWQNLDSAQRMEWVGRLARWQLESERPSREGLWMAPVTTGKMTLTFTASEADL